MNKIHGLIFIGKTFCGRSSIDVDNIAINNNAITCKQCLSKCNWIKKVQSKGSAFNEIKKV